MEDELDNGRILPPGYYDDPIKSEHPIDYVQHVYINDIDIPSWSHWINNWRYVPDPPLYIACNYTRQVEALSKVAWQILRSEAPDKKEYLDVMATLTPEEANDLMSDKWFRTVNRML